jgi:hypothetical protein
LQIELTVQWSPCRTFSLPLSGSGTLFIAQARRPSMATARSLTVTSRSSQRKYKLNPADNSQCIKNLDKVLKHAGVGLKDVVKVVSELRNASYPILTFQSSLRTWTTSQESTPSMSNCCQAPSQPARVFRSRGTRMTSESRLSASPGRHRLCSIHVFINKQLSFLDFSYNTEPKRFVTISSERLSQLRRLLTMGMLAFRFGWTWRCWWAAEFYVASQPQRCSLRNT